jgi:NAD(P)-dependent dehydrogenase (short-subunit alcohol dehydrogenase family)
VELTVNGRVALVTGGSRGIGLATASALASSGADVMIASRKAAGLEAAALGLRATNPDRRIEWFVANTGDPAQAAACVAEAVARLGKVDILVNNAATNPYMGPMIDIDVVRADKTVQVNQFGYLRWAHEVWHAGMKDHGGVIVNLSSVGGISVEEHIGYYNVTKAAVLQMTRQLAHELAPLVRVNAVAPGLIKTDFARALWGPNEEHVAGRWPLRRLGEPADVAAAVLFLCSDQASWITGSTIFVDGGALTAPALS